ncbi:hypothetical protein V5F77_13675 [Xanthobacter sp. DSM 24535]|uniref:tetratricopeptide repeat protein n=1 Tax=Roseixanthobacter psychrophilus TaxID=3119917 RepID=UPI0037279840
MTDESDLPPDDLPEEELTAPPTEQEIQADKARAALARVLASDEFVSSPRLADFLRFVVEATLGGRADAIKGYTIAVEALGRPTSFDPQTDPIVRVEATRLRRALERYYTSAGPDETLEIVIPKGVYVPRFVPRGNGDTAGQPGAPDGEALPYQIPPGPPPVAARTRGRLAWVAAAVIAAGALVWGTVQLTDTNRAGPIASLLGLEGANSASEIADRMGMPQLEVRPFEVSGTNGFSAGEVHAFEVRLRDAMARFDFVDVMSSGEDGSARQCRGNPPRSVFSLTGLAEAHEGGTFSLLVRLTDRCGGTIIWSTAFEDLRRGADFPASEHRVVRDIASAVMQSYGVLPTRARAQARADAPGSGFGCIAQSFAVIRNEDGTTAEQARTCLDQWVTRDSGFGTLHAVKAMLMLDEAQRASDRPLDPALLDQMEREAELATDLSPNSAYAAKVLASVEFFRGERDAAFAAGDRALALNPLDYDVAATVGTIMIGLGKPEQGEAVLTFARNHGAARTALQDAYLGIAAFMREDEIAATGLLPTLQAHPSAQSRIALALTLHVLGRPEEERDVVARLARDTPGGAAGVSRLVHHLLPVPDSFARIMGALEAAGLPQLADASRG